MPANAPTAGTDRVCSRRQSSALGVGPESPCQTAVSNTRFKHAFQTRAWLGRTWPGLAGPLSPDRREGAGVLPWTHGALPDHMAVGRSTMVARAKHRICRIQWIPIRVSRGKVDRRMPAKQCPGLSRNWKLVGFATGPDNQARGEAPCYAARGFRGSTRAWQPWQGAAAFRR